MRELRQSTSADIPIGPFLSTTDGYTASTGLTITQPDIRLKKNGGDWAQKAAAQTLVHEENGFYEVTLDTTDTNTLGLLRLAVFESGALPVWEDFEVVTANYWDSKYASDVFDVSVTQWLGQAAAAVTNNGVPEVDITHIGGVAVSTSTAQLGVNVVNAGGTAWGSGAITAASIATNAIDADALAADAGTEIASAVAAPSAATIANAVWDLDATAHQTAGTFGKAIGDPLSSTNSLIQRTPDAVAGAAGGLFIAGTNAATTITTALTTTFTGSLTGNVDGSVGSVSGLTASNLDATISSRSTQTSVDTIDNFLDTEISDIAGRLPYLMRSGTSSAGSPNAWQFTLDSGASSTDDFYTGDILILTGGAGAGKARVISAYDGTSKTISFVREILGTQPDTSTTFNVLSADANHYGLSASAIAWTVWDWEIPATHQSTSSAVALDAINDKLPALVSGRVNASVGEMTSSAVDSIIDEVIDGAYTMRELLRLFASALASKVSGAGTATITFRDISDTKDRIVATVDADGNRSAITLTVT